MTTLINASTTAGLIQTADTTGNLSLQSGGTTILALTSAGAAVTGTLSASGAITATAAGITVPTSALGNCYSGTYTPAVTNGTNVASSTAYLLSYIRVGNHVHVDGAISIDPTSSGTLTAWKITLPFASALTANNDLGGAGVENSNYAAVSIYAAHATDEAQFAYTSASTAANDIVFSFGYIIK